MGAREEDGEAVRNADNVKGYSYSCPAILCKLES